MSRDEISGDRITLLGYGLMLVFFGLASHAFTASEHVDQDNRKDLRGNLYLSSRVAKSADLASIIEIQSTDLEFMVWDHERRKLSRRLIELLRQRINIDPFDGGLWMQLMHLQADAGLSTTDRAWAIQRASKLLRWNVNERSELSYYCISEYVDFTSVAADLCSSIISNLPKKWSDPVQAAKAQVSLSDLKIVLSLEREKSKNNKVKSK